LIGNFSGSGAACKRLAGDDFTSFNPRKVTLNVGDESRAVVGIAHLKGGNSISIGLVAIRIGSTLEFVVVGSPTTIPLTPAAVVAVGKAAAARASSGLHSGRIA
jgi:hypothetical protein